MSRLIRLAILIIVCAAALERASNGDGQVDGVTPYGWWEHPASAARWCEPWRRRAARGKLERRRAEMGAVYDGLHPNAQGYTLMTPVASAAIAEALKR